MKNDWKERVGGVLAFGAFMYFISARFGNAIDGIYILIAFIIGAILILVLGNRHIGGKKTDGAKE